MSVLPSGPMDFQGGFKTMYRVIFLLFCLTPLLLQPAEAGDEDMLTPYAEFDPETGFFLPPDELSVTDNPPANITQLAESINKNTLADNFEGDSKSTSVGLILVLIVTSLMIVLGGGKIFTREK